MINRNSVTPVIMKNGDGHITDVHMQIEVPYPKNDKQSGSGLVVNFTIPTGQFKVLEQHWQEVLDVVREKMEQHKKEVAAHIESLKASLGI